MAKLPCPPELWPEFSALLDRALELADGERAAWLAGLSAEHDAVRPWLRRVIAGDGATLAPDFLHAPPVDSTSSEFSEGQHIGPYLLQRKLGSGGMGEVWLASRGDGTLKRQVALKLPHSHIMAGVQKRRFERERDILATLSHPNIAQLYDAGVADSTHPYLAMEWVDGIDINDHCRETTLSLNGRLTLFLQVLDAVGYAHGRFIAHRDLKPSNMLVTREERVKLLDFGIAKLLGGDTEVGATQLTRVGTTMATPGYAAPEQLAGEPITVAVDIYALGVVLYELLTGTRPHREVRNNGPGAIPRASSHIEAGHAKTVGGIESRALRRELSGDLDAMIAKALEADPAQRYSSAEAFAQDIRNSLRHRPISARRLSAARLTLMFVRRHWLGVTMTASLLLVIIGGSAGIAWQAVRAEREAQRATTIKDFLVGVFRASDPRIAADKPRGEITARELLDAGTNQIEHSFAQQPETQIELLGVTADIYRELEETKKAKELYARETALARDHYGATDLHLIDGLLGQADVADTEGDDPQALRLLSEADQLIHRASLDNSVFRARWLLLRGESLFGNTAKFDEVRASLEASAALFKASAPNDQRYVEALIDLGSFFLDRSMYSLSATYYQRAIAVAEANSQPEGDLLSPYAGLALARRRLGDFEGAATDFSRGTEIAERTYGRNTQRYWRIASDWAQFRYERGERAAAFGAFDALMDDLPKGQLPFRNATDAMEAANVLRKYGYCAAVDGQGTRAVALIERAQALLTKPAPRAYAYGRLQLDLASAYAADGRVVEARAAFTAALADWRAQNASTMHLAVALERWGQFLVSQNDPAGAAAAFDEALQKSAGRATEAAVLSEGGLAAIAVSKGDSGTALSLSKKAMDALDHLEGYYDIRIEPYVWGIRARSLLLGGDREGARALALKARDASATYYSASAAKMREADDLLQKM